jgi:hypothetical protein
LKKVNIKTNSHACINSGIRASCKRKRYFILLCRNNDDTKLENYYKTYCNILSKVIKETEKYHFSRLIENSDNEMKTIWDIAKLLTGEKKNTKDIQQINVDGTVTSSGQIIANSFNNYFLSIIGNRTPFAKSKNPIDYLYQAFKEPFPTIKDENTSTAEIEKIFESLKAKDSHGYDESSVKIFKIKLSIYKLTIKLHLQ